MFDDKTGRAGERGFPLSRRGFLGAAAGTAGGLLAGVARAQSSPADMPEGFGIGEIPAGATGRPFPDPRPSFPAPPGERLGWCVVGLGSFALRHVIPAIRRSSHCRLAAVVSGNPEKARATAAAHGLPGDAIYDYGSFDRIAEDDRIDVVYIVLPNALHAPWTIRAFEAGKHVMCEKPMAPTAAECEAMIDASRQAGRKLMIAYRAHFEPHNVRAKQMKDEGAFGEVRFLAGDTQRPLDLSRPRDRWRVQRDLAGGGSLVDIGIYALNGVLYFMDEPAESLVASISTPEDDPRFDQVEDLVVTQLRFPSGAVANLSSSYTMQENRIEMLGTKGAGILHPATSYYEDELYRTGPKGMLEVDVSGISADQFPSEVDHLSKAVMENTDVRTPGEMGLRDVRLMAAIYHSARTGGWVRLAPDGSMRG